MSQRLHLSDAFAYAGQSDPPLVEIYDSSPLVEIDDSSPLYAMYSKISQERDNRHVGHLQQHMDGLLVFTGLFSATIAALLAVTIPDLKPNSQDTSAFYLGNIYQIFANPNGSNGLIPSTLAKPPPFSPSRYVVWVNSLWLLALLINLSGALFMMSSKNFASRYISVLQSGRYSPEMRARVRARLANAGVIGFRDSSILPFCLHLSLFLFMAGLLIYLFNINHATFSALIWWVTITALVYAGNTFMPFLEHTLWYTPFSPLVLRLYLVITCAASQVCSWVRPRHRLSVRTKGHHRDLSDRYSEGFIEGQMKWAEEAASKPCSDIDAEVLERLLLVLDEDDALESFFDAIPGFCDSNLVKNSLDSRVTTKLKHALDGFLDRTFSSPLVTESARNNRVIICLNAAYSALGPSAVSKILGDFLNGCRDEALESVELGYSLIRWGHSSDDLICPNVRRIVACIISRTQDRNDHWAMLVKKVFGVPEEVIRAHLAHGDSVLLAILLHVAREVLDTGRFEARVLDPDSLSQLDIQNTSVELQYEFCALRNECIEKERNEPNRESRIPASLILTKTSHLFDTLHQGTDSAPVRFGALISDGHVVSSPPWSYPYRSCNIASHHPDKPAATSSTVPPPIQLGDSRITPPHSTFPSRLPLITSQELVTENAAVSNADVSVASAIVDPIRGSNSGGSSTLQRAGEAGTMPHSSVPGSLPTPIPTPALHTANSVVLPPPIDSALMQTDHGLHSLGAPPPTSTTIPSSVIPQVATISNQSPEICDSTTGAQYDNQDTHPRILSEDHRQFPPGGATGL